MEELLSGFLLEEHYGRFVKLTKRITDFNNDKELKRLVRKSLFTLLFLTERKSC